MVEIYSGKPAFNFVVYVPIPSDETLQKYAEAPSDLLVEQLVKKDAIMAISAKHELFRHGGDAHILGKEVRFGENVFKVVVAFSWG